MVLEVTEGGAMVLEAQGTSTFLAGIQGTAHGAPQQMLDAAMRRDIAFPQWPRVPPGAALLSFSLSCPHSPELPLGILVEGPGLSGQPPGSGGEGEGKGGAERTSLLSLPQHP